jgi:phosphoglycerate dehydrogenase-like enzyme
MKVVVIAPIDAEGLAQIAAVDPCLQVEAAWERFGAELVADWPAQTVEWYLPARFRDLVDSAEQRQQRDTLLADAEVLCIGFPFPVRLVTRAPRLRFVHQLPAGVSNLQRGDLWQSHVPITSGRGAGDTLAIAEWAIAAGLALSKEFPRALAQRSTGRLDRRAFQGRQVAGKTLGVIGLGGIGRQVARLGQGLGMRVIGMRRSAKPGEQVEQTYSPSKLYEFLRQCDLVVLAAQLTHETHHVIDAKAIAEMKPGAFLINVARGELIDEGALVEALRSRSLGGFAADVYEGEFDHQPPTELLGLANVILTPHTSYQSEEHSRGPLDIFRANLRRCLNGEPLLSQVDWERGY